MHVSENISIKNSHSNFMYIVWVRVGKESTFAVYLFRLSRQLWINRLLLWIHRPASYISIETCWETPGWHEWSPGALSHKWWDCFALNNSCMVPALPLLLKIWCSAILLWKKLRKLWFALQEVHQWTVRTCLHRWCRTLGTTSRSAKSISPCCLSGKMAMWNPGIPPLCGPCQSFMSWSTPCSFAGRRWPSRSLSACAALTMTTVIMRAIIVVTDIKNRGECVLEHVHSLLGKLWIVWKPCLSVFLTNYYEQLSLCGSWYFDLLLTWTRWFQIAVDDFF